MEVPQTPFTTVPALESIEPTERPDAYRVLLREASGHSETFVMTVVGGDVPLVTSDRDLSWGWPGNAASLRDVFGAVLDVHHRR